MAQYIDKGALVAEIERLEKKNNESENVYDFGTEHALKSILSFLDTLEVKEVVLEKELTLKDMAEIIKIANLLEIEWLNSTPWDGIRDWGFYAEVLKRFKAQKGE